MKQFLKQITLLFYIIRFLINRKNITLYFLICWKNLKSSIKNILVKILWLNLRLLKIKNFRIAYKLTDYLFIKKLN